MIEIDDKEFEQLRRAMLRLPEEIKVKAMNRVMRRITQSVRSRVVDQTSKMTKMPRPLVAALTTANFNAGGNTSSVTMQSGWIPLQKLGAVQNAKGVYVHVRGSYAHAFVATFGSGHVGVMRRVPGTSMKKNPKKEQLRELFAANPAHAMANKPEEYLDMVAEIMGSVFLPRFVHELNQLLPGK